jgi:transposase InsO family protein
MSKKGECYDNAVAESFFNTLKTEFISQQTMLQEHKQRVLYLNILKYFTTRLDGMACSKLGGSI